MTLNQNIFQPLILAGGEGRRLWPISNKKRPKYLLRLPYANSTLIEQTYERLMHNWPLLSYSPKIVGNKEVLSKIYTDEQIITEPWQENGLILNTLPAITYATLGLMHDLNNDDIILGTFPADQYINNQEHFKSSVETALECVNDQNIIALGQKPRRPSKHFGYIKVKDSQNSGHCITGSSSMKESSVNVELFTEKPPYKTAKAYVSTGQYFINCGIYLFKAKTLLEIVKMLNEDLVKNIDSQNWAGITPISFDKGICEPLTNANNSAFLENYHMEMVQAQFSFRDIGTYKSLLYEVARSPFKTR